MTSYLLLKTIHISCVALSGSLFFMRGLAMCANRLEALQAKLRAAPHIIDSVLLLSAIALSFISRQYPLQQAWLSAKIILLILYIILGAIALKRGRSKSQKVFAFIAALCVFSLIVSLAVSKQVFFLPH